MKNEMMPTMFHTMDRLTDAELAYKVKSARMLDLTTIELLNLIIFLRRKGNFNSLNSLLDYLVELR